MAKTVKLINRGQRTIRHKGFDFKPNALVEFPEEDAAVIRKLFKSEVNGESDIAQTFEAKTEKFDAKDNPLTVAAKKTEEVKTENKTKGDDFAAK